MHILYITNDWFESSVHRNLVSAISQSVDNIRVSVYVPLKIYDTAGVEHDLHDNIKVYTTFVLRNYHKLLYKSKQIVLLKNIMETIPDLQSVNLIHCATQCLAGGVALQLKKKMGIPYITTVRSTDIKAYYRFLIWRRWTFQKILDNANYVLFISEVYMNQLFNNYIPKRKMQLIIAKSKIIQNGIDLIYIANRKYKFNIYPKNIVYIGNFIRRKNIHYVIEAIKVLRAKGYNLTFTAIGQKVNDLSQYNKLMSDYQKRYKWIELKPRMSQQKLIEIINNYDIFTMVSNNETFGLVYIEALSQGLPILYTEGEGIDMYFEEGTVGLHAKSSSIQNIADKLEQIINNYPIYINFIKNLSLYEFKWSEISKKYIELYNSISR